jgi:hypothetical protein
VEAERSLRVIECDVPLVPVRVVPYDDVRPYSTTVVPVMEEVQVIVTEMELTGVTAMLDIAIAVVVKVVSLLYFTSDELVVDVDVTL